MSKTIRSNYGARLNKGELVGRLPSTIADAIQLVRSLGESYLWTMPFVSCRMTKSIKSVTLSKTDIVDGKAFAAIVTMRGSKCRSWPASESGTGQDHRSISSQL